MTGNLLAGIYCCKRNKTIAFKQAEDMKFIHRFYPNQYFNHLQINYHK